MRNFLILFVSIFLSSCGNNVLKKNYELNYNPNEEINLIESSNGSQLVKIPGHIILWT
jgi:hypothetical protein